MAHRGSKNDPFSTEKTQFDIICENIVAGCNCRVAPKWTGELRTIHDPPLANWAGNIKPEPVSPGLPGDDIEGIDWERIDPMLGKYPAGMVARAAGCSEKVIQRRRRQLGIINQVIRIKVGPR